MWRLRLWMSALKTRRWINRHRIYSTEILRCWNHVCRKCWFLKRKMKFTCSLIIIIWKIHIILHWLNLYKKGPFLYNILRHIGHMVLANDTRRVMSLISHWHPSLSQHFSWYPFSARLIWEPWFLSLFSLPLTAKQAQGYLVSSTACWLLALLLLLVKVISPQSSSANVERNVC